MSLNIHARRRQRYYLNSNNGTLIYEYEDTHMRIIWNLERMHEWWFIFNIQLI